MSRTISRYECEWNGQPIPALTGQMVEPHGPGNNTALVGDNDNRRIREGTYRLAIQDGTFTKPTATPRGRTAPVPASSSSIPSRATPSSSTPARTS